MHGNFLYILHNRLCRQYYIFCRKSHYCYYYYYHILVFSLFYALLHFFRRTGLLAFYFFFFFFGEEDRPQTKESLNHARRRRDEGDSLSPKLISRTYILCINIELCFQFTWFHCSFVNSECNVFSKANFFLRKITMIFYFVCK